MVMIKVSRDAHKMLQSALFFIRKVGQYDAFFNTLHISGKLAAITIPSAIFLNFNIIGRQLMFE